MQKYLLKNIHIVNEGNISQADILLTNGRIEKIANQIDTTLAVVEIDGTSKYLLPGVIDDQVHFREPGLTHKGNIYTVGKIVDKDNEEIVDHELIPNRRIVAF